MCDENNRKNLIIETASDMLLKAYQRNDITADLLDVVHRKDGVLRAELQEQLERRFPGPPMTRVTVGIPVKVLARLDAYLDRLVVDQKSVLTRADVIRDALVAYLDRVQEDLCDLAEPVDTPLASIDRFMDREGDGD